MVIISGKMMNPDVIEHGRTGMGRDHKQKGSKEAGAASEVEGEREMYSVLWPSPLNTGNRWCVLLFT